MSTWKLNSKELNGVNSSIRDRYRSPQISFGKTIVTEGQEDVKQYTWVGSLRLSNAQMLVLQK